MIVFEAGRMYENVKSWNPFVGCLFNCIYCYDSFRKQAKRWRSRCIKCYNYEPHFHPERLNKIPSKKTIFACSMADISFAKMEWIEKILNAIEKHEDKTFYIQTKNPTIFERIEDELSLPKNTLKGITLETDLDYIYNGISKAPKPSLRYQTALEIKHLIDYITIEPILEFSRDFANRIKALKPKIVYVGYESHRRVKLPEPQIPKTLELIEVLDKFTEVRIKGFEGRFRFYQPLHRKPAKDIL